MEVREMDLRVQATLMLETADTDRAEVRLQTPLVVWRLLDVE